MTLILNGYNTYYINIFKGRQNFTNTYHCLQKSKKANITVKSKIYKWSNEKEFDCDDIKKESSSYLGDKKR